MEAIAANHSLGDGISNYFANWSFYILTPMLKAVPKNFFSWNYTICLPKDDIAVIDMAWLGESSEFYIEGATYRAYRESLLSGTFILESRAAVVARAEKPNPFFRSFIVEYDRRQFTLEALSPLTREFGLFDGRQQIGSIYPNHLFTRSATIDLPDNISLPVKVFMFWLVMILWRRASRRSASTPPSGS